MNDMELQQYNFLDTKLQAPGLSPATLVVLRLILTKLGPYLPRLLEVLLLMKIVEFLPHFFLPAAANMGR
jgi:hypothetical protein